MSTTALVFGANGYIGFGVAVGLRRAGLRVFGVVRQSRHSTRLLHQEIEPIVVESFENVSSLAEQLQQCSVIVDAVGFKADLSETILQTALAAGQERTQNGQHAHYAPLFVFTSGIMTCKSIRTDPSSTQIEKYRFGVDGDTSMYSRRPIDERNEDA